MADEAEGGDGTPVGDTPEVHDGIHPGDLPPEHPARPEAERRLAQRPDTTELRGDVEE